MVRLHTTIVGNLPVSPIYRSGRIHVVCLLIHFVLGNGFVLRDIWSLKDPWDTFNNVGYFYLKKKLFVRYFDNLKLS